MLSIGPREGGKTSRGAYEGVVSIFHLNDLFGPVTRVVAVKVKSGFQVLLLLFYVCRELGMKTQGMINCC